MCKMYRCWAVICTFLSCSIKLGVIEDASNRTRLSKLLRFFTSNSEDKISSLAEYVERMKEKQDAIYFIAGKKYLNCSPIVYFCGVLFPAP